MVAIFTGLGSGFERGSAAQLGAGGVLGGGTQGRGGDRISVNAANGNLLINRQDEFLIGQGLDAAISRTYNSLGPNDGDLNNDRWRESTNRRLKGASNPVNVSGAVVTRVSGDGSEITYTYETRNGVAAYWTDEGGGSHDKITHDSSSGKWTWEDGDTGIKEVYYGSGTRIREQVDQDGNTLSFSYSASKLTKITTDDGGYLRYVWSGNNIVRVDTYAKGEGFARTHARTGYVYDELNRLVKVVTDLDLTDSDVITTSSPNPDHRNGNLLQDGAKAYTTTYSYVGDSKLIESITQSDGSQVEFSYDTQGRVIRIQQHVGSNDIRETLIGYAVNVTSVTDPSGSVTKLYHDAKGQLVQVVAPPANVGGQSQVVQYEYDNSGNLIRTINTDSFQANISANASGVSYDETGEITRFAYDLNGNVRTTTDAAGVTRSNVYDANNNLIRSVSRASTETSYNSSIIEHYVYDAEEHLRYTVNGAGYVTEYRYDPSGNLTYEIQYTQHRYPTDFTNQSETDLNTWRDGLDRTESQLTRHYYDVRGNRVRTVDYADTTANGSASTATQGWTDLRYTYDSAGRLLTSKTTGDVGTSYSYDGLGRTISSTSLAGGITQIDFNDTATTTTIISSLNGTTTSTYDKAGGLLSAVTSGSLVETTTVSYEYDKDGRVRIEKDGRDYKTYYVYDNVGNLTATVDHKGYVQEFRYDEDGRQIASARYTQYKSGEAGSALLTQLNNPNNALTAADVRFSADLVTNHHEQDIWNWTSYDVRGQISQTVLGDGSVTTYEYDKAGRLIKTHSYFNKLSDAQREALRLGTAEADTYLPAPSTAQDQISRTFYNRAGQVAGTLDGNGYLTQIKYDAAGRKVQESVFGNLSAATDRASGTFNQIYSNVTKSTAKDAHSYYVYDGQGYLRYEIDAQGRVTEFVYGANEANFGLVRQAIEYAQTISVNEAPTFTSMNGIMASQRGHADNRVSQNFYNTQQQLTYTIDATGSVTRFEYDVAGNIVRTTQFSDTLSTSTNLDNWADAHASDARITRSYYNAAGQLRFTIDAEGYVTRTDYNESGQAFRTFRFTEKLTAVTNSWTIHTVSSHRNTSSNTNWVQTRYEYDHQGRLTSTYDANGTRSYTGYHANGEISWEIRGYGHGAEESRVIHYNDASGRLYRTRYYQGDYNNSSHQNYRQTNFHYDGLGNIVRQHEEGASHTDAGADRNTDFEYDASGNLIKQTDAKGGITRFEYNAFGQVTKTTDPRGHSSFNYYNKSGQLTLSVDAEGYATQTAYNNFGEVSSVTRRYTQVSGTPTPTNPPGIVTSNDFDAQTRFYYDKLGRVVQTRNQRALSDGTEYQVEFVKYDAFGQQIETINKTGGKTYYAYDDRGLLTQSRVEATTYASSGVPLGRENVVNYTYDNRGNQKTVSEGYHKYDQPAGVNVFVALRATSYVYDDADRLIQKIGANVDVYATDTDISASNISPTETYAYDRRGNLIESIDANDGRTLYYYDKLDRVTHQISAEGTLVRNWYDASSNLIKTKVYAAEETPLPGDATGAPPSGGDDYRETEFTYDRLNRMVLSEVKDVQTARVGSSLRITRPDHSLQTSYEYDANGNVIKVTDPNGGETFSYYDDLGRKTHQVDAEGYLTRWTYDANGNVTQERRVAQKQTGIISTTSYGTINWSHPSSTASTAIDQIYQDRITDYEYDEFGRRIQETRQNALVLNNSETGYKVADSVIKYTYNALGRVTQKTEATGDFITYNYDAQGRLSSEVRSGYVDHLTGPGNHVTPQVNYYYNALGDLARTRNAGKNGSVAHAYTKFEYDVSGRLNNKTDAENFVRHYVYDAKGQLLRESYTRDGHVEGVGYRYDLEGRVVSQGAIYLDDDGEWSRSNLTEIQTRYNAFGDVSERGVNGIFAEKFDYDNAGRVWRTTSGDGIHKYFLYDNNGNQTVSIASDGADIENKSLADVLALWGVENTDADNNNIMDDSNRIRTHYVDGVNATLTKYDARNLAVEVLEPERESHNSSGLIRSDLVTKRAYNAFGDVTSESDAHQNTIEYYYNTMGRRIRTVSPEVSVTHADGTTEELRPTEHMYYDVSGRLVASRDANNNLTRQTLLSGTGYGGTQALITETVAADGGTVTTEYDIHGNARTITNQLGHKTTQTFDRLGRVKQINHAGGLKDYFRYDGLGQKTQQWNNVGGYQDSKFIDKPGGQNWSAGVLTIGSNLKAETEYDAEGRVISQTARGGDVTTYSYAWNGSLATAGIGTFGGWTQTTTYANHKTLTVEADIFGRQTYKNDLGSHVSTFTYNKGGQLTSATGVEAASYTYLNTGKLYTMTRGAIVGTYHYDKVGNLKLERQTLNGQTQSYGAANYDALGRVTQWVERASGNYALAPDATVNYTYDANGNVRSTDKTFHYIWSTGETSATASTAIDWFAYDAVNRVVVDKGDLVGNNIVRGRGGVSIAYDAAGQRAYTLNSFQDQHSYTRYEKEWIGGEPTWVAHPAIRNFTNTRKETYSYTAAGQLHTIRIAEGSARQHGGDAPINDIYNAPTFSTRPPSGAGTVRSTFTYDFMGQLTGQKDRAVGGTIVFDRSVTYNGKGQIINDHSSTKRGNETKITNSFSLYRGEEVDHNGNSSGTSLDTILLGLNASSLFSGSAGSPARIVSNSGSDAKYALGAATRTWTWNHTIENGDQTDHNPSETSYSYDWHDGAQVERTVYLEDVHNRKTSDANITTHNYNANGHLTSANISDGQSRTVRYTNDLTGQVLKRKITTSGSDPTEIWYRFGGREMGYIGNNGTLNVDTNAAIEQRTAESGTGLFRNGAQHGARHVDFDQNYTALNSYQQGSASGGYTVRGGDTLQGIASGLYGDSALWYKIAQANGISGDTPLIEGTTLRLPAGVTRTTYNASTFKPYDPGAAIGDTSPTAPEPPKAQGKNCGAIGIALTVVVAVVVFAITKDIVSSLKIVKAGLAAGGTTAAATSAAVAATSAAAASAASQGAAIATGIQDKFSFKQVGIAALTAGLSKYSASLQSSLGTSTGLSVAPTSTGPALGGFKRVVRAVGSEVLRQSIRQVAGLQSSFNWASVASAGLDATGVQISGTRLGDVPGVTQVISAASRSLSSGNSFGDELLHELPNIVEQAVGRSGDAGTAERAGDATDGLINFGRGLVSLTRQVSALNQNVTASPVNRPQNLVQTAVNFERQKAVQADRARQGINAASRKFFGIGARLNPATLGLRGFSNAAGALGLEGVSNNFAYQAGVTEGALLAFPQAAVETVTGLSHLYDHRTETALQLGGALGTYGRSLSGRAGNTSVNIALDGLSFLGRKFGQARAHHSALIAQGRYNEAGLFTGDIGGKVGFEVASSIIPVSKLGLLAKGGRVIDGGPISQINPNFSVGPAGNTVFGGVARIPNLVTLRSKYVKLTDAQEAKIIYNKAQSTGTPGHAFRSYREAIKLARDPNVVRIHLDHGYNKALGLNPKTISPNRRPDVTAIYNDGRVRRIEVQSKTDDPTRLRGRNNALDSQIIAQGFSPYPTEVILPTTR